MNLRYPNSRLLIFNLLHQENIRCNEALIRAAYTSGLITPNESRTKVESSDCNSMPAIDEIVKTYFNQRYADKSSKEREQLVKKTVGLINTDINNYRTLCGLKHPTNKQTTPLECSNLAPAAFDFLLQHLP